ncbi:hypothetical protein AVEN_122739-1 [Araneus ventricosus]|uniref:Uncharacterized protein n=1 Tax=Araneus ventricosus TaxID=182803 RepID=A0A4Y2R1N8_ARAVE|nr:hypothetical protein AVEN_122739-1 [Araneus ventricosus]
MKYGIRPLPLHVTQIHPQPVTPVLDPRLLRFIRRTTHSKSLPPPNTNAYLLSTMLIYGRQSKWSGGYRDRLDMQPSAPHRINSDWVSTLTTGFGVERS